MPILVTKSHGGDASGDPKSIARKPKSKAESLGQVFTPAALARVILEGLGVAHAPGRGKLLDPCVGPATFPKALNELGVSRIDVDAFDIDPEMVQLTRQWAAGCPATVRAKLGDYLELRLKGGYDFAILNPPYVRQEWIERKAHYRESFKERFGCVVPGTSNLYVYFIIKALGDLKEGGKLACIVYDSWQSTRFGQWLQEYLNASCSSVVVEAVPALPFDGRLIDATIIYAVKGSGNGKPHVFRQGTDLIKLLPGMRQVEALFHTKRGLRLKQADFFLTDLQAVDVDGASPFVKKVNLIPGFVVPQDHPEAALLLSSTLNDERTVAALQRRLGEAKLKRSSNVSILTWWRERPEVWAQHTTAPRAPLIFNYYLRRRPRHIYNPDRIFADNFYGLIPREKAISPLAWLAALNSTSSVIGILERARNQGAGLAKIQLFEYRNAYVMDLTPWSNRDLAKMTKLGEALVSGNGPEQIIALVDALAADVTECAEMRPKNLKEKLAEVDRQARKPKE